MRHIDSENLIRLDTLEAGGCARFGAGEATCRWKCGSQCAHPAPNPSRNDTFQAVLHRFVSRRSVLRGAAAAGVAMVVAPHLGNALPAAAGGAGGLTFKPITLANEDRVVVPEGYASRALLRWGDPLFTDSPAFDPTAQTAEGQARQFGYNCD